MPNDRSFEGTVRDRRPKINENERAESPDEGCHDDKRHELAPPHREIPVDDPGEDGQDGERHGIFVFQNKPVHLIHCTFMTGGTWYSPSMTARPGRYARSISLK